MTPRQRAIFGFFLLGIWALLIAVIAVGKVYEASSYGLHECITGLGFLSGSWVQATFGDREKGNEDKPSAQTNIENKP